MQSSLSNPKRLELRKLVQDFPLTDGLANFVRQIEDLSYELGMIEAKDKILLWCRECGKHYYFVDIFQGQRKYSDGTHTVFVE